MKTPAALALAALLAGAACTRPPSAPEPPPPAPHHDDEAHEALPRTVRLPPGVAERAGLETSPVRRAPLPVTLALIGEIAADPDRTARLSTPTAGRLEEVRFNEGSPVKRGEVLATVRVPDVGRLRGALAAATSRARAARANAERLAALRASGLGAEQALVDAEADAKAQEAEARALGEQLAALGAGQDPSGGFLVALRAPLSGVVVARSAIVGQPIAPDTVLGTIVDLSEVWFLGRIFEKDLSRLRPGQPAEVELNAWPGEHFHGAVDYVSQQIDPVARTLTARIRLANDGGRLRLGLFGRAHVDLDAADAGAPRLLVPRDAIFEIGGAPVVFVEAEDGDYVLHEVTVGASAMDEVEVLSGVGEGEQVVSRGGFTLKSLVLKSTLAEDE